MDKENLTAVILAGGRATRMGGSDKGLVKIGDSPLVKLIADQVIKQVDTLVINANRNLDTYRTMGFTVVEDEMENYQGPLAGMLAALKFCNTDWILTIPCDGPFVAADYTERMMRAAKKENRKIVVASDGDRLQPVYALLHQDLVPSLETFLESGERKIDRWYAQEGFAEVSFSDQMDMFTNVNTPEQLTALQNG